MIFKDLLNLKLEKLDPVFSDMLQLANENQVHKGDLLLIHINGFYNPEVHTWDNLPEKRSPYMFGNGYEGQAAFTHEDYIQHYFNNNFCVMSHSEYIDLLDKIKKNDSKLFQNINDKDAIYIQNEMLIYLKIWESDLFIKKLYQLIKLIKGESYDWHFEITPYDKKDVGTGSRSSIIREKIRDNLKNKLPELYDSLLNSYNTQIRNAIAHSQYYINGNIILNNYKENDPYNKIRMLTREEWANRIHESLAIYMQLNKCMKEVNRIYGEQAIRNQQKVEIKINRTDPIEEEENKFVYYRSVYNDWSWNEED